MDLGDDLTLKTYLHWLIKLPDHASYSNVSFINVLRPKIFHCHRRRKNQQMTQVQMFIHNYLNLNMFRALLCPLSGEQTV